jgi:hypothetical protein
MTTMINPQMGPLPDHLPGAEPALCDGAVSPRLVHRVYDQDVFTTNVRVLSYNTFQVGVRWPGTHSFYGPVTPDTHDPLMFLESVRQAGLLVAHVAFDIPRDFKFIIHETQFSVSPAGLRTDGRQPVDVQMIVTAHDVRRRGRGFAGMRFEFACMRDGVRVASARYVWSCVSAAGYDKLRGAHRTAMPPSRVGSVLVAPRRVGRLDELDVMLAESADESVWVACIAPDHPSVYDHHFDHVPGTGAFEVARQAALLAAGRPAALPVGGDFAFHHYIEFDKLCLVSADVVSCSGERTTVRIVFEQEGVTVAAGTFELLGRG